MFTDFNSYIEGINLIEVLLKGGIGIVIGSLVVALFITEDSGGNAIGQYIAAFITSVVLMTVILTALMGAVTIVKMVESPDKESVFIDSEGRNLKSGIVANIEELDYNYNGTKTTEITLEDGSKVYTPTENKLNKYLEKGDKLRYREHNLYRYIRFFKGSEKEGTIKVAILSFEENEDE